MYENGYITKCNKSCRTCDDFEYYVKQLGLCHKVGIICLDSYSCFEWTNEKLTRNDDLR